MEIMIDKAKGLVNHGDWARICEVMRRGMSGGALRIAFLGGSITQGYLATVHEKSYSYLTCQWWKEKFPNASVEYINAGIGGTSSQYGSARVQKDVLDAKPDVVFVEFSVNDLANEFFRETYEGMVRRILEERYVRHTEKGATEVIAPAVILLHSIKYDDGSTSEAQHVEIGKHYGLPCISMRSTLYAQMKAGEFGSRDITEDDLHPNDTGHRLMAEVICHALDRMYEEAEKHNYTEEKSLPAPLTQNCYESARRWQHRDTEPEMKGFQKDLREKQYDTDCFRGGWRAEHGGDEFVWHFTGSELAIQYRRSVRRPALIAEAIIDGDTEHSVILDANFDEDWGDCLAITTVMRHGRIVSGQSEKGSSPANYGNSFQMLKECAKDYGGAKEHELRIRILGTIQELGWRETKVSTGAPAWMKSLDDGGPVGFDLVSLITGGPTKREKAFPDGFIWGVADSAYQTEGTDPEDGRGRCVWDDFVDAGKILDGSNAYTACDRLHHYPEDLALMRNLGIRNYRFSVSWARIIPNGKLDVAEYEKILQGERPVKGCRGGVNWTAITMYRDMLRIMQERGIRPFLTLYHWETPSALESEGGWLNPEIVKDFGDYARVVAEQFSEYCDTYMTLNEPQCFVGMGYGNGYHAPGKKLEHRDVFTIINNVLKAHGQAVINLRKYAGKKILVGFAPTCGAAIPVSERPEDIEAARKVYFGFYMPMERWTWNVTWYSDPVLLGKYPKEGLERFQEYLPEFTDEDMELIHQPLDFIGQNIYNGYYIKADENGEPVYVDRPAGFPLTATKWPNNPESLYWGARFIYERYHLPVYITENGVSCADNVSADGHIHDTERIEFLDAYLGQLLRAIREGVDVRGYFAWTFLDNFEWEKGYTERFGMVWVDFLTQKRMAKDSALWYQETMRKNGANLTANRRVKEILFIKPTVRERIWGGERLKSEWGYDAPKDRELGECWIVSCNDQVDGEVLQGTYKGRKLSELWKNAPELFGNPAEEEFPLLVKVIDARENLSIQVHPDEDYARAHENSKGKRECWYILDAPEDAKIIAGNRAGDRDELRAMVEAERWDDLLNYVPVKKGDFLQIDPGTLHSITAGIMLLEVQQNSDVTYRVYDYDRLQNGKPRELHIKQSLEVTKVPNRITEEQLIHTDVATNTFQKLVETADYKVWMISIDGEMEMEAHKESFLILSIIEGDGVIDGYPVKRGQSMIVPWNYPSYRISGKMRVIVAAP